MSKTLNNTATAKHIAKQHGLTFTYSRSRRLWILAARHHVAGMRDSVYTPSEIADFDTDTFYMHCMEVAALTITPDQMKKVVERIRHVELLDACDGRDMTKEERAEYFTLDPYSADKQVHSMEDSIYQMRMDAEAVHGDYYDHKAQFKGVRAVASYGKGKHIGYSVDGRFVMSLPAQLNNGRIPCPEECDDILNGESVTDSDGWRNRAHDLYELARRIVDDAVLIWPGHKAGAAMVATSDGTVSGVRFLMWCGKSRHSVAASHTSVMRLHAHWRGFLKNCEEAQAGALQTVREQVEQLAEDQPAERRAEVSSMFDQMQQRRTASVPAVVVHEIEAEHVELLPAPPDVVHVDPALCASCAMPEPGDPCDKCGACLHAGQSDMCDDCRQDAPEMTNFYQCPRCEHEWSDVWTCAADDDCPSCGARHITPYDSEEVTA